MQETYYFDKNYNIPFTFTEDPSDSFKDGRLLI